MSESFRKSDKLFYLQGLQGKERSWEKTVTTKRTKKEKARIKRTRVNEREGSSIIKITIRNPRKVKRRNQKIVARAGG